MASPDGVPEGDGGSGPPRAGSRRGARRGAKPPRRFRPDVVGPALAALGALVIWGVLVWVAVDAGRDARAGADGRWTVLAVASAGAALALFGCLWCCTVVLRRLGVLAPRPRPPARDPE